MKAAGPIRAAKIVITKYPIGRRVASDEMTRIKLQRDGFRGEWDYVIRPRVTK